MKKFIALCSVVALGIAPAALAAVTYTRLPGGTSPAAPITMRIQMDSWSDLIPSIPSAYGEYNYWDIDAYGEGITDYTVGCIPSSTLDFTFDIPAVPGDSIGAIEINVFDVGEYSTTATCVSEGEYTSSNTQNGFGDTFTVAASSITAGASANPGDFTLPTSFSHDLTASVSNVFGDAGILSFIVIAAALDLVFWFAYKVIGLFRLEDTKSRAAMDRADRAIARTKKLLHE